MPDEKKSAYKHKVIIEQRERVGVTGVVDVISFDEETIIGETDLGVIIVRGTNLHVNKLNLDSGELDVDGDVYSVTYEDQAAYGKNKTSFFSKMFK